MNQLALFADAALRWRSPSGLRCHDGHCEEYGTCRRCGANFTYCGGQPCRGCSCLRADAKRRHNPYVELAR